MASHTHLRSDITNFSHVHDDLALVTVADAAARDALPALKARLVYRLDVDRVEAYDGTDWFPVSPNEVCARQFFAATNAFTNQTTYAVFPQAGDRTALTTTLVKTSAATALHVTVHGSVALSSGAQQPLYLGLRVGGTDYDVARRRTDAAAILRQDLVGDAILTGVPAGSLTIEPVFKSDTTASCNFFGSDDLLSYRVTEVR